MTADIAVRRARAYEQPLLAALLELYQYDFTEFSEEDVDEHGRFGSPWLDRYWSEPERSPFLLYVDGRPAGFALVRRTEALDGSGDVTDMTEFFVMRRYRRRGAGEHMAAGLFARFPGRWQVRVVAANLPAQSFWRTIIGRYTGGRFDVHAWDTKEWRGPVFYFQSGA
jgi:predicted acetyltransferase